MYKTETNYLDWEDIFVFLSLEQSEPIFQALNVPNGFLSFSINGAAFRQVIRDCLPEVIHFKNRDIRHFPGVGNEDYRYFWDKLEVLLAPITTPENVRELRQWGNKIRLRPNIPAFFDFEAKYKLPKDKLSLPETYSIEERMFFNLANIYFLRDMTCLNWLDLLELSVEKDTEMVNWINSLDPEMEVYKPLPVLENALNYMRVYAHDLMVYQFAYSIQTTFTREVFYGLVDKLVEGENDFKKFRALYDLSE